MRNCRSYPNAMAMVLDRNHYVIERWGTGYAITVRRAGCLPATTLCNTLAEANRLRMELGADGIVGFNVGAL